MLKWINENSKNAIVFYYVEYVVTYNTINLNI